MLKVFPLNELLDTFFINNKKKLMRFFNKKVVNGQCELSIIFKLKYETNSTCIVKC